MKLRNKTNEALSFTVDGIRHTAGPGGEVTPEISERKVPGVLRQGLPLEPVDTSVTLPPERPLSAAAQRRAAESAPVASPGAAGPAASASPIAPAGGPTTDPKTVATVGAGPGPSAPPPPDVSTKPATKPKG